VLRPLLLVTFALAGCASQDLPPVIDAIDMPPTATLDASGFYTVSGSMTFHDPDDLVATLRVTIPLVQMSYDYPVGIEAGAISPLTVKFSSAAPKGIEEYDLTLIDEAGLETVAQKTVTLE
jgi:hypothetical protein